MVPATSQLPRVEGEKILTPERQVKIVNEWRIVFGIQ
jgi:hypothetical protein